MRVEVLMPRRICGVQMDKWENETLITPDGFGPVRYAKTVRYGHGRPWIFAVRHKLFGTTRRTLAPYGSEQ